MKLKNTIKILAAGAMMLSAQSCLFEQKDIFPESSSERLQGYIEDVRTLLTTSENGWVMEYYPGTNQALGGYAYYLKFTETEVEAIAEIDPENAYASPYKITTDNGAVLSFDVYNPVLHYFATPSSSEYQAKGGDFEFTIISATPEKIGLIGKRSGNHYDMYPYTSELKPMDYMAKVAEMSESMRAAIIEGKIGETEVSGSLDFDTRKIIFNYNDGVEQVEQVVPYMYTDEGIKTYETVEVAGYTVSKFYYHVDNNILTTGSVVFYGKLPEDYTSYADFTGNFTLTTGASSFGPYKLTFTPNEAGDGFVVSGFNSNFTVNFGYNKAKGRLTLEGQVLGTSSGSNYVKWCPWDADSGYLTWMDGVGMEICRDLTDPTGTTFYFVDNGIWEDHVCNSFILYEFDSSDSPIDGYEGWGEYRYPLFKTLKRN